MFVIAFKTVAYKLYDFNLLLEDRLVILIIFKYKHKNYPSLPSFKVGRKKRLKFLRKDT